MAFHYTEQHRTEYNTEGLTILRGILPATLLSDLRREAEKARDIARLQHGPQAQRLQPVWNYDGLVLQPFRDFLSLPEMRSTVEGILGTEHRPSERMAVFLEPARDASCTAWHRDWGNVPGIDLDAYFKSVLDIRLFNQLNAALYDDHSLWVVPRSDRRSDTDEERASFASYPPPTPDLEEALSAAERESACMDYARKMPGGKPISLFAGDVAFYRACMWHLGCYTPYGRRATLHDSYLCDDDRAFQAAVRRLQQLQASS
jgi:hypothetical protein